MLLLISQSRRAEIYFIDYLIQNPNFPLPIVGEGQGEGDIHFSIGREPAQKYLKSVIAYALQRPLTVVSYNYVRILSKKMKT